MPSANHSYYNSKPGRIYCMYFYRQLTATNSSTIGHTVTNSNYSGYCTSNNHKSNEISHK